MAFLLNSQAQGVSGKMNQLPKHHARGPMQLHRLKAGPVCANWTAMWTYTGANLT